MHNNYNSVPVSAELKDLLTKLLTKDPEKRATLSEIRLHPWVCSSPRYIPSKEENCNEKIDVSEEDIQKAIRPFYTPIHILVWSLLNCVTLDIINNYYS